MAVARKMRSSSVHAFIFAATYSLALSPTTLAKPPTPPPLLSAADQRLADPPRLTPGEELTLRRVGRVESVKRQGRVGEAFCVVDCDLEPEAVYAKIADVEGYQNQMCGVRQSHVSRAKGAASAPVW